MTQTADTARDDMLADLGALWITLDTVPDPVERLDLLRTALNAVSGELERTVTEARGAGATWERIGNALAVSKQAAQQRFRG